MNGEMSRLLSLAKQELFVPDLSKADQRRVIELKKLGLIKTNRYGPWSGGEYVSAVEEANNADR